MKQNGAKLQNLAYPHCGFNAGMLNLAALKFRALQIHEVGFKWKLRFGSFGIPRWNSNSFALRGSCTLPNHNVSFEGLMTIKGHDCVVLTADLPGEGLGAGDVGTVIHIHEGGTAYEVEFTTLDGRTLTVAAVEWGKLRLVSGRDVAHVRVLSPLQW